MSRPFALPALPPETMSSPGRTVTCIDPLQTREWDELVLAFPGASFFHSQAWARALHTAYGYRPVYIVLRDRGEIRCVLPLMEVSSWLTGTRGVGLPFTDECAALASDPADFRSAYRAARALGLQSGWRYLELRGAREWLGDVPSSTSFFGHRLDLRPGAEALFAACDSAVRRAVRKAEKSAVRVEFAQSEAAMDEFYRLMCITRQRHGVPPQPRSFFRCLQQTIMAKGHGWVVLAQSEGKTIAGAVYFRFGTRAIYKYGASDERFQHVRANNLVMWEAIKRFAADGCTDFDFGRTDPGNEGLRQYKRSWGAAETTVSYAKENLRTGHFERAGAAGPSRMQQIFRVLPQPLLRMIGAALYRHVA